MWSGHEAHLTYQGHALRENRHGLAGDSSVMQPVGIAEREVAALAMAANRRAGATLGADKGYDTVDFVATFRDQQSRRMWAQNTTRQRSAIDGRTTRPPGHVESRQRRKWVEEILGWAKEHVHRGSTLDVVRQGVREELAAYGSGSRRGSAGDRPRARVTRRGR